IGTFPESNVVALSAFTSYQDSEFGPTNRIAAPFGAHLYSAGARRPRPVACVGFDLSSGSMDSSFSALNSCFFSPVAAETIQSDLSLPFVSRNPSDFPSGVHDSPEYRLPLKLGRP